jgi:transcription-repair coupling factor (superfamily II helicase)
LSTIKRLASATHESVLAELEEELRDRFGPLPEEASQLLSLLRLKLLLRRLGIKQLDSVNGEFVLTFAEDPEIDLSRLTQMIAAEPESLRLTPECRLYFKSHSPNAVEAIAELKNLLHNIG